MLRNGRCLPRVAFTLDSCPVPSSQRERTVTQKIQALGPQAQPCPPLLTCCTGGEGDEGDRGREQYRCAGVPLQE